MPAPGVAPPASLALGDVTGERGRRPHVQRLRQPGIGRRRGGLQMRRQGDFPRRSLGVFLRVFESFTETAQPDFQSRLPLQGPQFRANRTRSGR